MFPSSSESRVENRNGDSVVSRENKRCEWAGRRVVKQQLLHEKDTSETRMQNLDEECKCWRLQRCMSRLQSGLL